MMKPTNSPWGSVQHVETIIPLAVFWVSTASHGGLLVDLAWAHENLTQAACAVGAKRGSPAGYAFEEDCDYAVVCLENYEVAHSLASDPPLPPIEYRIKMANYLKTVEAYNASYLIAAINEQISS